MASSDNSPKSGHPSLAATAPIEVAIPRSPRLSTSQLSPGSGGGAATSPIGGAATSPLRQPSIADLLSTPPPLITTSITDSSSHHSRRASSASRSSDDASTGSVTPHIAAFPPVNSAGSQISRDWQEVPLSELVQKEKLIVVDSTASVEQAFETLDEHDLTSVPIRDGNTITHTFDYADLNAYLLLVLGHIEPIDRTPDVEQKVVNARAGKEVPVKFVSQLGIKDPYVVIPSNSTLSTVVEILGNGVHRIAVSDPATPSDIIGIVSQRRLIRYIWENGRLFKSLEPLFQKPLSELHVGSTNVLSINGEEPVIHALQKMHNEGVSSLAVVDNNKNLLGNISIVDVRLLTKYSQSPLLRSSCKQFLNVILSKRGLQDGKDSFPVFYVTQSSTLGRTLAKMVATRAHRLWIVQPSNPSSTDSPGAVTEGHLTGVVSLTDILYLFAKHAGKEYLDPNNARRQRRRSSSSSVRTQSSVDAFKRSLSIDRR
ncbi:Sds24p [Sugiyamaella lignohabitans]|uniref:Sds24p n=1 Tax=Sugiyamaella lignohabitans TaxID=796027 RepID=A0A167FXA6_9ASCO|nr:Sds24p [Sugiyamaella lignohabitans]ANB15821.1 Sds24p [Sugiyamaella lignohabitans]